MPAQAYVGLALSSHAPAVMATATFSDVQITGNVTDGGRSRTLGSIILATAKQSVRDCRGQQRQERDGGPSRSAAVNARTGPSGGFP